MKIGVAVKKISDIYPHDRPREKIREKGAATLSDYELIAAILGSGTRTHDVLSLSREVAGLISKGSLPLYDDLLASEGIGHSKASVLLACFELIRRYGNAGDTERMRITCPDDIVRIPEVISLKTKKQEHFVCTTLNGASEVIRTRTITMGLLNHSLVHPREVFADAIQDRAAAIICTHNHPSGNSDPSDEDIRVTRQLNDAGNILGISLLDHLIITKGGITSLKSLGYL